MTTSNLVSDESNPTEPSSDLQPSASPRLKRRRVQQLSSELGRVAGSVVGCGVIGWACYNLVANIRFLRATEADEFSVWLAVGVVAVFCLVPFAVGIWLVAKSMK